MSESPVSTRPSDRLVGLWLVTLCALTACMVLVGGATRLTDSGLSITEWDFFKHFVPPLSDKGWAEEFSLYQRTTEFQVQNHAMTLEQFKGIYLWEWGHRFLGQVIGLVFAVPFLFFLATGRLRGRALPVLGLGLLGALQGAIGWWMVTSGLFSGLDVSAVRLGIHLMTAFLILAVSLTLALRELGLPARQSAGGLAWPWLAALAMVLLLQIFFGALVAGKDAGLAASDWPKIGGRWAVWNYGQYAPFISNFTENLLAVQFHHRMTGYAVAAGVLGAGLLWLLTGRGPARTLAGVACGLVVLQTALGVAAIMLHVPLPVALAHQAGAVALWLTMIAWINAAARVK